MTTQLEAAKLKTKQRDALPSSDFAVPGKRVMPINDKIHVEKAWQLKDTAHDLTPAEKTTARKRIIRRAKELGIDTSNWQGVEAADHEEEEIHLSGMSFYAMALNIPEHQDHPNKILGEGVLTKLDQPSDAPLGGSNGRRVILPKAIAEQSLSTLLGMPLDFSDDFSSHEKTQNIGSIYEANIEGNDLKIKFYLYGVNFPEQVKRIQAEKHLMGFSYEMANISCDEIGDDLLEITRCTFTGAAVLYKDKAAYKTTSLNAHAETSMNEEILKKLEEMTTQINELKAQNDELKASQEKHLQANASYAAQAKPSVDALRAAADCMQAAGIGTDPKRGHIAAARSMADDIEAQANLGKKPQIYQTQDFLSASADADKKIETLQAGLADMNTKFEDLKKSKFEAAAQPERKTLSPEIKTLLAQANIIPGEDGKLNIKQLDAALEKTQMNAEQRIAFKSTLRQSGSIA